MLSQPKRLYGLFLFFLLTACERDTTVPNATLTLNNNNALAIWAVYVAPTATPNERSVDLLASDTIPAAASKTFTIDTCGINIDITAILSNGNQQSFTDVQADCGAVITQDVI